LKVPSPAHRAIARLVAIGAVRVIITTNFDRLTERALEEQGVVPDIVDQESRIPGAMPYAHCRCLLVKVHGDYLDTRNLNTVDELASYKPKLRRFLLRILEDHGLVVCGWSGEYDTALADVIMSTTGRRFGLYWMHVGALGDRAVRIIADRRGTSLQIESADAAFGLLLQRVEALKELDRPSPLDSTMVAAITKRMVPRPDEQIQLREFLTTNWGRRGRRSPGSRPT